MPSSDQKKSSSGPVAAPEKSAPLFEPRFGRVRAAWLALRGERLVPQQIQSEWLEYQQIFESVLQRLSAQLARQAKSEKLRIESLIPEEPSRREPSRQDRKAELRSRAAEMRGLASFRPRNGRLPQEVEAP